MNKLLGDTQGRYTPDAGEVDEPVNCGVCGELMKCEKGCYGARGFAMAMSGSKSHYDDFICPYFTAIIAFISKWQ